MLSVSNFVAFSPISICIPVIKSVLSVLSKKDVVAKARLAAVVLANADVFCVPLVKFVPACKKKFKSILAALSSSNAPVVSAGKFNSILFHEVVTEKGLEQCLELSLSAISQGICCCTLYL